MDWDARVLNSREHDSQCTQNSKTKQDKLKVDTKITEVAPDGPLKNEIVVPRSRRHKIA